MFTGLVEEIGTVRAVHAGSAYRKLTLNAEAVCDDLELGDSISVNGACQTVAELSDRGFSVEVLEVSQEKTTLGRLSHGDRVNLERAVTGQGRFGGHFVQGHVDGTGRISNVRRRGANAYMEIILPEELSRYCISEGSIAVDGVSLTIAALRGIRITINIIPSTWNATVLQYRQAGDTVNIEVDVMARYAERLLGLNGGSA